MYQRDPDKPKRPATPGSWKPGVSGNPKGRPKSGLALADMIRERLDPETMREFVAFVINIAFGRPVELVGEWFQACRAARQRGEPPPPRPTQVETIQPDIGDMQRAWDFLATWGFQKPTQVLEINGGAEAPALDYSKLSPAELDQLEASLRKAAGMAPAPAGPNVAAALLISNACQTEH